PDSPGGPGGGPAAGGPGTGGHGHVGGRPWIPLPRIPVEDGGLPSPVLPHPGPAPLALEHPVLKSLLGAWA
ncbi:hypothetical protein NGM37_14605, partial [Streptomyces sp. TRM76130]|nr:hypothetical protein [Streptomyces sp. TRM76130]